MSRRYAEVIGDPVAHSKSPLIHNFWLEKIGIDAEYRAVRVLPEALTDYLDSRRTDAAWCGCNATIPHKQAIMQLCDALLAPAERVGASNCIYRVDQRLVGENSDVDGVLESLDAVFNQRPTGIVCMIGTGGAARAALYALTIAGASEVRLVARDTALATVLLTEFGLPGRAYGFDSADAALADAETIINATPLGMLGQRGMPELVLANLAKTTPNALVFDMVYAPLETPLLAQARQLHRPTRDGLTMLIGQADLAFALFYGQPTPREHDAELRALLTA